MCGSASMIATAPCGPTVIPYSRSVGPRGFVGAAVRPGGENRTAGAVRSWEKMLAATMASYLGTGGALATRARGVRARRSPRRSEEHTSELQSLAYLVCRLLLEKKTADCPH